MLCLVEREVALLLWEFPLYRTYLFRYWVVLSVLWLVERVVDLLIWEISLYETYLFRYWVNGSVPAVPDGAGGGPATLGVPPLLNILA